MAICFFMYTVSSGGRLQEIRRAASATTPPFVIRHAPARRGSEARGGPPKTRPTTTLSTPCLAAWLDFGGSVRLKRLMRHKGRMGGVLSVFWLWGAEGLQTGTVRRNLRLKGLFLSGGMRIHSLYLEREFDRGSVTQNCKSRCGPSQASVSSP
jgi:hypothetical protein